MRRFGLLLLIPFLMACGQEKLGDEDGDGGNNPSGGGPMQFKNFNGTFQPVDIADVVALTISVTDSTGKTTLEKVYTFPNIGERIDTLGFATPGTKTLTKMKKTGNATVEYLVKGTGLTDKRTFDIYSTKYLQDSSFNDVVYTSSEEITFDWLK